MPASYTINEVLYVLSTSPLVLSTQAGGGVTALNNQAANRLVTIGATTTELDGEANATYDGTDLTLTDGVWFTLKIAQGSNAGYQIYALGGVTQRWGVSQYTTQMISSHNIAWSNSTSNLTTLDLHLYRDAAGTLAQHNLTNAQTSRLYAAYAGSGTDFSRLNVIASLTDMTISATTGGTYSSSNPNVNIVLTPAGTGKVLSGGQNLAAKETTLYVVDFSTAVSTGDGNAYFRIPAEMDAMDLVSVGMQVGAAQSTSGTPTVQIARLRAATAGGVRTAADMLSTLLTIDINEWDSKDATAAAVIDTSNDDVNTGDLLRIDIDVAGTGTQGLFVTLGFA